MARFITPLRVIQIAPNRWQLESALMYASDLVDEVIVVPHGFITDFASVPRLPLAYLVAGGKASAPAVVHDWMYSTRDFERDVADAIFREAIRVAGHSAFTAWIMWAGVRVGGGFGWNKPNLPQPPHIDLGGL